MLYNKLETKQHIACNTEFYLSFTIAFLAEHVNIGIQQPNKMQKNKKKIKNKQTK